MIIAVCLCLSLMVCIGIFCFLSAIDHILYGRYGFALLNLFVTGFDIYLMVDLFNGKGF